MGSKFLSGTEIAGLDDGTAALNVLSVQIQGLSTNQPLKTDVSKYLTSTLLSISDTSGLNEALQTKNTLDFVEQKSATNPDAGNLRFFAKSGAFYQRNDAGVERELSGGSSCVSWLFDSTIGSAPTDTYFRMNNATPASVSEIYVSEVNASSNNVRALLQGVGNGDSIYLATNDQSNGKYYTISAAVDSGAYFTFTVTLIDQNNTAQFTNNDTICWQFFIGGANQSLNTTDSVTFADLSLTSTNPTITIKDNNGSGLNNGAINWTDQNDANVFYIRPFIGAGNHKIGSNLAIPKALDFEIGGKICTMDTLGDWLPASATQDLGTLSDKWRTLYAQNTHVEEYQDIKEISEPASPSSGYQRIWVDSNSIMRLKDDTGTNNTINNPYNRNTTLQDGGILSATQGTTVFNISAGFGSIIDSTATPPSQTTVTWTAFSNVPVTNILTTTITYVLIDVNGQIVQQSTLPTPLQRRQNIYVGYIGHGNQTTISGVVSDGNFSQNTFQQIVDLATLFKVNITGNSIGGAATNNLRLLKSSGIIYQMGVNYAIDKENPNYKDMAAIDTSGTGFFFYVTKNNDSSGAPLVDIIPNILDDGSPYPGSTYAASRWGAHRVFLLPTNTIFIQPAQFSYNSLSNCLANYETEDFVITDNLRAESILICYILTKGDCTNLNDAAEAQFINVTGFSTQTTSSGSITADLQTIYENSSVPQITTTNGTLVFKEDSNDTADVIRIRDTSNTLTSYFRADGLGKFTDLFIIGSAPALRLQDNDSLAGSTNNVIEFRQQGGGVIGSLKLVNDTISLKTNNEAVTTIDLGTATNSLVINETDGIGITTSDFYPTGTTDLGSVTNSFNSLYADNIYTSTITGPSDNKITMQTGAANYNLELKTDTQSLTMFDALGNLTYTSPTPDFIIRDTDSSIGSTLQTIDFQDQSSTVVAQIVQNAGDLSINNNVTNGSITLTADSDSIKLDSANNAILPTDDTLDLGGTSNRFKDIHITGSILGGTTLTSTTWLTMSAGTTNYTLSNQTAKYTKIIGDLVFLTCTFNWVKVGTQTGDVEITLPYTVATPGGPVTLGNCTTFDWWGTPTDGTDLNGITIPTTNTWKFRRLRSGETTEFITGADMSANGFIGFSVLYFASS